MSKNPKGVPGQAEFGVQYTSHSLGSLFRTLPTVEILNPFGSFESFRRLHWNAPDALVIGYESLIPSLNLPDEKDRHVPAAAIQSKASVIVTNNLKDFPPEVLQEFEIEAQCPDEFVMNLLDLAAEDVYEAAEAHRLSLKNPPKTIAEYLNTLESHGLVRTVAELRLVLL
ncbi:MAG TPA: hypothetical protein VFC37_02825 [Terracidiphilus sp.]|nr:hypothetical protein [Terracidiphilus sp.]